MLGCVWHSLGVTGQVAWCSCSSSSRVVRGLHGRPRDGSMDLRCWWILWEVGQTQIWVLVWCVGVIQQLGVVCGSDLPARESITY